MLASNITAFRALLVAVACVSVVSAVSADDFGSGANAFSINFVTISGASNPSSGIPAGTGFTFVGVDHDYRMGVTEVTNDQYSKFAASLGVPVTGTPSTAYDSGTFFAGANVSVTGVSWLEAAQFVNWLNTSTGNQAAYKFTGTQGTGDYALALWDPSEAAADGTNLFRHKDAKYYLPTEDEWVKAGYWNGSTSTLQTYTTKTDTLPLKDVGGWNYYTHGAPLDQPWDAGSGSEELNGTYDMTGNVQEWIESPYVVDTYATDSNHALRGGTYTHDCPDGIGDGTIKSDDRQHYGPYYGASELENEETGYIGFRVASAVPEPGSILLLSMGGLMIRRTLRRRR